MMEEELACPRCKTTKYRNPSLKLMVNVCGHGLCESCVDLLFLKGSGSCPECGVPLRRSNFRVQLFEDPKVEKEVDIRKRVLKDYNKKEEDFASLREYDDYLEEIETIVHNLTNDIDIVATNKRIEHYKKENRDIILKNKTRAGREDIELEEILEMEKREEEIRRAEIARAEREAKKRKLREKEALIDELMFSEENAKNIVDSFAQSVETVEEEVEELPPPPKQPTRFSSGIQFTRGYGGIPALPQIVEGPLFVYVEPVYPPTVGPPVPPKSEILSKGFLNNVRAETEIERAGGYNSILACTRALQEAFAGLYYGSGS